MVWIRRAGFAVGCVAVAVWIWLVNTGAIARLVNGG